MCAIQGITMNIDNPKGTEPLVSDKKNVRRTFLKRATATAVVGAIPAKSVWATGISNSIVASGHGSDFAFGRDIELLSPCSILTLLSTYTDANLDLNFLQVFGEGPDQAFSEILSCHCGCPSTIRRGISNVVFLVQPSGGTDTLRIKVDEYGTHGDIKDPSDPTRYYAYILAEYAPGGTVLEYVIKAGQKYYNQDGVEVSVGSPQWYTGFKGRNIDEEFNASESIGGPNSSAGNNCEGDETTLAMIAIYLNARFDYYFRGGIATENWTGANGIYYPILSSNAAVSNLVASIKASKNQLTGILAEYNATFEAPICS
jgi:hypothetical protein